MKALLLIITLTTFSFLQAQQTYVPDDNFEAYLESNGMGNGIPNDDSVLTANISGVTSLGVSLQGISDLTGIEDFSALTYLNCNSNSLLTLNLSQNFLLQQLFCAGNNLTSLDFNSNPQLSNVVCQSNPITSLNLNGASSLSNLNCALCQLTFLDVSNNPALTDLNCQQNPITSLNLNGASSLSNLNCALCQLTFLDVSNNPALTDLNLQQNSLNCISANNGTNINLNCSFNPGLNCVVVNSPTWSYNNAAFFNSPNIEFNNVFCSILNNDILSINNTLTAVENNATYQWLDCTDNYAIIPGENNQSYIANSSGYYAVIVSLNDCFNQIDTSSCAYIDCQSEINNDLIQNGTLLTADQNSATYQWLDCANNYAVINGETNQSFTATITGYYAVEITITDACGGVQVDTSSCHLVDYSGIEELTQGTVELLKITDLMGRETKPVFNTPLIYYYSDGTIERVFKLEE